MAKTAKLKKGPKTTRLAAAEKPRPSAKDEAPHARQIPHAQPNERYRIQPLVIRLTEGDDGVHVPSRIQLFRTGTFKKLMPDGKTVQFSITRETLQEMVENWKNRVRGTDIALDFAHRSDEEAAAWFKNLIIEDYGHESQLWAEVDWTPDGRAAVGGKKFRYVSPDFAFAWTDNETGQRYGATLFGAGLTNRPVIKHMAPTVELQEDHDMENQGIQALTLRLDELEKANKSLQLKLDELSEDDADEDGDADADANEANEGPNVPKLVAGKKGKKKEAPVKSTDDMNLEELKGAHQKLLDEMAEMKKTMAQSLAETRTKEKEAQFTLLLAEGKVVPAQKEAYLKDDMAQFLKLAEKPKFQAIGGYGEALDKKDTPATDKVLKLAREAEKQRGVKPTESVSLVLSEHPELNKEYMQEMDEVEVAS